MLTTVQGQYRNGIIQLEELPPNLLEAQVIVTFFPKRMPTIQSHRPIGLAPDCGESLAQNFNDPLPTEILGVFNGEGT
ncbi:conserved hypothetical protein [Gammaproteobacteria bacterium]